VERGAFAPLSLSLTGESAYKKGQLVGTDVASYLSVKTRVMREKGLGDEN
jgi:hypothetical protein